MTEIRTKDKLFVAVVLPVAIVAAYIYFWRAEAGRRVDELAARSAVLVKAEDFDFEMARAKKSRAEALEELEAEKKVPTPEAKVRGKSEAKIAERERAVMGVLREAGLVIRAARNEGEDEGFVVEDEFGDEVVGEAYRGGAEVFRGGDVLKATGVRPEAAKRIYMVEGRYPQVVAALEIFATREMAVVVEKVEMREGRHRRWVLTIWL